MKHLRILLLTFLLFSIQYSFATVYYVSVNGSDATGDGSSTRPWRTLHTAALRVPANQGHTIKLLAGTFVENAYIQIPSGVNIEGSGIGVTVLKPSPSIYYTAFTWLQDRFLLNLNGSGGNQSLKDFTLDGVSKQLYGGVIVNGRSNVLIQNVRVQYFYFTGIWFWNSTNSRVTQVQLKDNAMGTSGGASASILLSNCERMEVDHLNVDEAYGQAFEAVSGKMYYLDLHDNRFSVSPKGNWQTPTGATVPNLCVEFYDADLRGCKVYNNYFDNNLSIVQGNKFVNPTGIQTIRVHDNVFDMIARAGGAGHAIELTIHDAEVDHNYIRGGSTAISNWDASPTGFTRHNWKIHHNVVHDLSSGWPTAFIAMFRHGVNNAHIYNNTVESTGGSTIHFLEVNNSGVANNVRLENNLIIDSNTSYNWGPNQFLSVLNGARFQNSVARNNFLQKLPVGALPGVTYSGNLTGNAMIQRTGAKPAPFFELMAGSPLIDKGVNVGSAYAGAGPDIGAYEYGGATTTPAPADVPQVAITGPTNNSNFEAGQSITITATASRANGTISKVEFFNGVTKLGEDATSPYAFTWASPTTGTHILTAIATDQAGGNATSSPVTVTITQPAAALNIPGAIIARDWSQMSGVQLENTTDIGGGQNVGYIEPGDWIDYKVNVASAGKYTVQYRVASLSTGGTLQLKSGESVLATTTFAATQGWQNWATVEATVNLAAGQQTLRVIDVSGIFNINWIEFKSSVSNAAPTVTITTPANGAAFDQPAQIQIQANASDTDGSISRVEFYNGTTLLGTDTTSPYAYSWADVPGGSYSITAVALDNASGKTTSTAVGIVVKTPDVASSHRVPGTILAKDWSDMYGVKLENTKDLGGGQNVGYIEPGDWIEYKVNVASSGSYGVRYRVASFSTGGTIEMKSGETVLATTTFAATGAWQNWITVDATVTLSAGVQTLRLFAPSGVFNVNWIEFGLDAGDYVAIPAKILAKDYSSMSGVKLENTADVGGGQNVGYIEPGDWMEYNVNASSAGRYVIKYRVASLNTGGNFVLESGDKILDNITVPATGAWQNWTTIESTVELPAGNQTLRLRDLSGLFNVNWIEFVNANIELSGYVTIPATILAKDYTTMSGVKLENTSDTGGGQNVGYIEPGDWMEYKVNAPAAGTYTIRYRVASLSTGGHIELISGTSTLASTSFASTGAWQNWTTVSASVQLAKGPQTLRLFAASGIFNVNWIEFTSEPSADLSVTASASTRTSLTRIFSPNNDGINDTWLWVDPEIDPTSTLVVYNTSGQVVHEGDASQDPTWDGTLNGSPLQADVYYYVIHHADTEITGALQLVR